MLGQGMIFWGLVIWWWWRFVASQFVCANIHTFRVLTLTWRWTGEDASSVAAGRMKRNTLDGPICLWRLNDLTACFFAWWKCQIDAINSLFTAAWPIFTLNDQLKPNAFTAIRKESLKQMQPCHSPIQNQPKSAQSNDGTMDRFNGERSSPDSGWNWNEQITVLKMMINKMAGMHATWLWLFRWIMEWSSSSEVFLTFNFLSKKMNYFRIDSSTA